MIIYSVVEIKILALDTATAACSVALSINGEVRQRFEIAPRQHAELILPMVEQLLAEAGLHLTQLDAIAFGHGPGSFMGVRIATGIAQGLSFGADLPLIPVSTLQVLAQTAYQKTADSNLLVAWDARMHAVYWGAYCLGADQIMQPIQADALSAPDKVFLPTEKKWSAAGNGWLAYQAELTAILDNCQTIDTDIYPQADALIRIAEVLYHQGKRSTALEVEPVYLRDEVAKTMAER